MIREAVKRLIDAFPDTKSISIEKVHFAITAGWRDRYGPNEQANKHFFPDIIAHRYTIDTVKDPGEYDSGIREKFVGTVIVECETVGNSTLVTGKPSLRLYGYQMMKHDMKQRVTWILMTFDGIVNNCNLWDEVWTIPKPKT